MRTLNATSWNGEPFVYNVARNTWQMTNDVMLSDEHSADEGDMESAEECAKKGRALFGDITLDELELD